LVAEESVNDVLIASYVYGLDLISQERGVNDSFYLVDGLGSTRGLTDASGVVTDTYSYDAFGNLIASAGGTANNYLFAGEQFDSNLDQYYLRQRYYNQNSGRFTRRDTYEGSLEDPMSLHKYLYGNANPVTYTDPTGLFSAGEAQAAADIANTLAGIQWESGQHLIFATINGGDYDAGDFGRDIVFGFAATGAFFYLGWKLRQFINLLAATPDTVRVYRVEGTPNTRVIISEAGEVILQGDQVLFLNFGDRVRAERYLNMKVRQGLPGASLKSFEIPRSYYEDIRANAVPEVDAKKLKNRGKPFQVDHTGRPENSTQDSYALRKGLIEELQRAIIQGSGMIEYK
jgi:RHS repeat-associated protein